MDAVNYLSSLKHYRLQYLVSTLLRCFFLVTFFFSTVLPVSCSFSSALAHPFLGCFLASPSSMSVFGIPLLRVFSFFRFFRLLAAKSILFTLDLSGLCTCSAFSPLSSLLFLCLSFSGLSPGSTACRVFLDPLLPRSLPSSLFLSFLFTLLLLLFLPEVGFPSRVSSPSPVWKTDVFYYSFTINIDR